MLLSTTVSPTLVVPNEYGPAGDCVTVTLSPSGSYDAAFTDAFALEHRLRSVPTVAGLQSALGETPMVPVMLAKAVVDGVMQLEFVAHGVWSVSTMMVSLGPPNDANADGANCTLATRLSPLGRVAPVGWPLSRL